MQKKNPQIDIYKSLRTNRIITLGTVIIAGIVIVMTVNATNNFSNSVLELTFNKVMKVDNTGQVQQLTLVDRSETIKIEISDHLERWFDRYYDFTFNTVQKKPLQAQWLITKDNFDALQEQYKQWHQDVRLNKYTQTALLEPDSIQVTGTQEPYQFSASTIVTVSNGYSENRFRLKTTGEIIFVDADYPKNPHGFLIRNYKEESNTKID
jgi:hypothetical protein